MKSRMMVSPRAGDSYSADGIAGWGLTFAQCRWVVWRVCALLLCAPLHGLCEPCRSKHTRCTLHDVGTHQYCALASIPRSGASRMDFRFSPSSRMCVRTASNSRRLSRAPIGPVRTLIRWVRSQPSTRGSIEKLMDGMSSPTSRDVGLNSMYRSGTISVNRTCFFCNLPAIRSSK